MTKKKETIISVALIAGLTDRIICAGADSSVYLHAFYSFEKRRYLCVGCSFHESVKWIHRTVLSGTGRIYASGCLYLWNPYHSGGTERKCISCILTAVLYSLLCRFLLH